MRSDNEYLTTLKNHALLQASTVPPPVSAQRVTLGWIHRVWSTPDSTGDAHIEIVKTPAHSSCAPLSSSMLQSLWSALNTLYFDNRLPLITIQWSTRLTSSVGLFVSQCGPRTQHIPVDIRHGSARVIRLSLPLLSQQSVADIRGTLAHEMIHQWQFDIKQCHPSHGREFRRMMNLMNKDGLGITIYHTLTQKVEALSLYSWQCQRCGQAYHRQRKSLSPKTHQCGSCQGELRAMTPGVTQRRLHEGMTLKHPIGHTGGARNPIQLAFAFLLD